MPRYGFSIEDGTPVTHPDATEELADDAAAMDHARAIAHDFTNSAIARSKSRVVVRDEAGHEIGDVPLLNVIR